MRVCARREGHRAQGVAFGHSLGDTSAVGQADPTNPWYIPRPAGPYLVGVEDPDGHPEWHTLVRSGTGDGLRVVEWESNTGQIRMTAPTVLGRNPETPAP